MELNRTNIEAFVGSSIAASNRQEAVHEEIERKLGRRGPGPLWGPL